MGPIARLPGSAGRALPRGARALTLALLLALPALSGCFMRESAVTGEDHGHAFMSDARVRRALGLAFDHALAQSTVHDGFLAPLAGPVPEGLLLADAQGPAPQHDPHAASALLDKAGYPRGVDGYRFGGATLRVVHDAGSREHRLLAEQFVERLDRIGVRAAAVALPWPEFVQRVLQGDAWDVAFHAWSATHADPDAYWLPLAASRVPAGSPGLAGDALNTGHASARLDSALLAARRATDPLVRASHYGEAHRVHAQDPSLLFVGALREPVAFRDHVTGETLSPALTAPGPFAALRASGAGPGWTLRYQAAADARSLDPAYATDAASRRVVENVYDGLLAWPGGDAARPALALAEAHTASADGRTHTFTLRETVRFSTGNALTAADVAFTFTRLARLAAAGEGAAGVFAPLLSESGVTVLDARTVRLTLQEPYAGFAALLASPVAGIVDGTACGARGGLPRLTPEGHLADPGCGPWLRDNAAGTGAWRVTERARGERVTLERAPLAWSPAPEGAPARVELLAVPDAGARVAALAEGRADAIELPTHAVKDLRGVPGVRLAVRDTGDVLLGAFRIEPGV